MCKPVMSIICGAAGLTAFAWGMKIAIPAGKLLEAVQNNATCQSLFNSTVRPAYCYYPNEVLYTWALVTGGTIMAAVAVFLGAKACQERRPLDQYRAVALTPLPESA